MFLTNDFCISAVMPAFEGCDQTRQGCRIQEGTCLCGIGCYSEYRYSNYEECHKALKGKKNTPWSSLSTAVPNMLLINVDRI